MEKSDENPRQLPYAADIWALAIVFVQLIMVSESLRCEGVGESEGMGSVASKEERGRHAISKREDIGYISIKCDTNIYIYYEILHTRNLSACSCYACSLIHNYELMLMY